MDERPITDWLPLTKKEVEKRGWDELDVILISGDAYVDHPAFGTAVIGRIMDHADVGPILHGLIHPIVYVVSSIITIVS